MIDEVAKSEEDVNQKDMRNHSGHRVPSMDLHHNETWRNNPRDAEENEKQAPSEVPIQLGSA
jgi:hypothetical protein